MSERTKVVVAPLTTLLDLSLRFARMQEQLYSRALAEVGLQSRFRSAVEARYSRRLCIDTPTQRRARALTLQCSDTHMQ